MIPGVNPIQKLRGPNEPDASAEEANTQVFVEGFVNIGVFCFDAISSQRVRRLEELFFSRVPVCFTTLFLLTTVE